jgi:hypothetical protein
MITFWPLAKGNSGGVTNMKNVGELGNSPALKNQKEAVGANTGGSLKRKILANFPYFLGMLVVAVFALALVVTWWLKG